MENIIRMIGAVALIIWGTYMVKTGMLRTFGDRLRNWLSRALTNRFSGFAAGAFLAALLQSSTAGTLLVAGLQGKGLVSTAIALSCVLGADLGSALMSRVLSLDISLLSPVLITAGAFLFLRRPASRPGQFGRVLLGLGFILLALSEIMSATLPLKESAQVTALFTLAASVPALSLLLGTVLALACFSSLAVVIIVASLASAGLLPGSAPLWAVLGANLGSALLALITSAGGSPSSKRAPAGNMVFRACGAAAGSAALAALPQIGSAFSALPDGAIYFHIAFNLCLGLIGLAFIGPVARLVDARFPQKLSLGGSEVELLSEENLLNASTALGLVRQEELRSLEILRSFWDAAAGLITGNPPAGEILLLREKRRLLERRSRAVSRFLTALLASGSLTAEETAAWQRLKNDNAMIRAAALAADSVVHALDKRKCRIGGFFSKEGADELLALHRRVGSSLALLTAIIAESDAERLAALRGRMAAERQALLDSELPLIESHMKRVASGVPSAVQTSTLHLELLTLFRRVIALACSAEELEA